MSAIFGVYCLDGRPVPQVWLTAMQQRLSRLGPDHQGLWQQGEVGLGQCLLAIAPEARYDRQPVVSEDGHCALVMTGWVKDRESLYGALKPGGALTEVPDSTLLLCAYRRWGEDCVRHVDGEFSLAVFDRTRGMLFLAQSCIAATPLYYVHTAHLVAFATRITPLLALPGVTKELDPVGFARAVGQFRYHQLDLRQTCFQGIERCPPATWLRVGPQHWHQEEYWQPEPERATRCVDPREVYGQMRERLRDAVRQRIRSPYPVACLLSGGLDSSSLTCLAAQHLGAGQTLVAVSAVLSEGMGGDERPYIEVVRKHLDVEIEYVTPPEHPSTYDTDLLAGFFAEEEAPVLALRNYLYHSLFQAAARHGARVVLDGVYGELGPSHAGDTLLPTLLLRGRWHTLAHELTAYAQRQEVTLPRALWSELFRPFVPYSVRRWRISRRQAHPSMGRFFACLRTQFLEVTGLPRLPFNIYAATDAVRWPWETPSIGILPTWRRVLRAVTSPTAYRLTGRFPFRDRALWEYVAGLPLRLTQHDGWRRHLLRAAMEGILPPEIQWRTSKGPFSPDYYLRLQKALPQALDICAAVRPGDLAEVFLDLAWLRATITSVQQHPQALHASPGLPEFVQGSIQAIQFLRWFERQ